MNEFEIVDKNVLDELTNKQKLKYYIIRRIYGMAFVIKYKDGTFEVKTEEEILNE